MDIGLDLVRYIVIHDSRNRFHIESSGSHIGCNHGGDLLLFKSFEDLETPILVMLPVQGARRITASPEISIKFDHRPACVAEYDAGLFLVLIQQLVDPVLLRPVFTMNKFLIDFWDRGDLLDGRYDPRIFHEPFHE